MKIFLITAAIITLVVFGAFGLFSYQASVARPDLPDKVQFVVKPGEKATALASRLESDGVIVSRLAFLFEILKEHKRGKIIAGVYEADHTTSTAEIIRRITSGESVSRDLEVTFPEGFSIEQITKRLTAAGLPGEEVRKAALRPDPALRNTYPFLTGLPPGASLEGFLFPDTYRFDPDATAEDILADMLQNFGRKVPESLMTDIASQKKTLFEVVTLASIVEEEGRTETDRKMISDIFWKRLAEGQPLQSDATINYIHGTLKDQSSLSDLESTSPYNTY
jgi:UPF0755 protein